MLIRRASTIRDALAMRRVRNTCNEYMTRDQSTISRRAQLLWWFTLPNTTWPFVVEGDEIVGYGLVDLRPPYGWLTGGLLPVARGCGLGRALFSHLIQETKKTKLLPTLEVRATNIPALRLYAGLGFRATTTADGIITMTYDASLRR